MTAALTSLDVIDIYAADAEATVAFYEKVFGLTPQRHPDCTGFGFANLVVHVRDAADADGFIDPAALIAPGAGGRGSFTMFTQHVDAAFAALTSRGVTLINGPADRSWGIRNACFADPSGQLWEIAGPSAEAGQEPATNLALFDAEERNIGSIVLFAADVRARRRSTPRCWGCRSRRSSPTGRASGCRSAASRPTLGRCAPRWRAAVPPRSGR